MISLIQENSIEMTDIPVRKYLLESFYTVGQLPNHDKIKPLLHQLIDDAPADSLKENDDYYTDSVQKLDWATAKDFTRPWTVSFKPSLDNYLNELAIALGYQKAIIEELWFQQYGNGDTHGWHTHGSNFTGVYYLELDGASPKTEIIEPSKQDKKMTPDVREGDVLIFPSYTIHRAPVITDQIRKTIISFNFIFDLIDEDTLTRINGL